VHQDHRRRHGCDRSGHCAPPLALIGRWSLVAASHRRGVTR
jgi:hypothetical protein